MKITDKYLFSDPNDIKIIQNSLISRTSLSGTSIIVEKYEKKLATFFNSQYAIAVSSGTAAIQTALYVSRVNRGDEVIVSSICPLMTVLSIVFIGARPVFCDTKVDNFGLDIDELKKLINPKTKAVIEVPMWGYPTSVDKLRDFTKTKGIPLILDLAQAHGTLLHNKYLSYYGDISCFSTHDRKILATGEGGFLLTDNKEFYDESKCFIQFGNMNGVKMGLNYKISSLQAALGTNRINHINKQLNTRQRNAKHIVKNITNQLLSELKILENGMPNYYALILKLNFANNLKAIEKISSKGVPSDILRYNYKVLYEYPLFKSYKRKCKNSEKLVKRITTIPVHPALKKEELDYIIKVINNISIKKSFCKTS